MPKAKAKLAEPSPQRSTAFDVVCDTEEDLMAVIHFARALTFMDGLSREETDAVQRIARSILVSVRKVLESYESAVIQEWWPDSRRGHRCGRARTAPVTTAASCDIRAI